MLGVFLVKLNFTSFSFSENCEILKLLFATRRSLSAHARLVDSAANRFLRDDLRGEDVQRRVGRRLRVFLLQRQRGKQQEPNVLVLHRELAAC